MTKYVLEILDGDRSGETIPLRDERITVGRRAANTIQLNDEKVSGLHAEIVAEEGRYVLRDLESTNGTLLDGRRIDEIALSSRDILQIGRVRMQFREVGAGVADDDLALHRVDQARLQKSKRRRGVAGLVAVVVLFGAAGGWYTWQLQQTSTVGPSARRAMQIDRVAGNKLPEGVDDCEDPELWDLAAAGLGFELGGPPRSGATALMALRTDVEPGEPASPDFALARLATPLPVAPGERLELSGHLRTSAGGRAALRLRFSSSVDPGVLWSGTEPIESDGYTEVTLALAVPRGMDRVEVEALALLPAVDAEVLVDDLALLTGGDASPIELSAAGYSLVGSGTGVMMRVGRDPVVSAITPLADGAGLAGLARSGLLGFSDAGLEFGVSGDDNGFRLAFGGTGVELVLAGPPALAGVLIKDAGGVFRRPSGDGFEAADVTELLVGSESQRLLLRMPSACAVQLSRDGDRFTMSVTGAGELDLVAKFDAESRAAHAALREARDLLPDQPGAALDRLRKLVEQTPHDSAVTRDALQLRAELLGALGQRLEELRAELDKAEFFRTRGAYTRIAVELADIAARYGEHNIPQPETAAAMQEQVAARLAELDAKHAEARKTDLQALAEVFAQSEETDLQELIQNYLKRHYEK